MDEKRKACERERKRLSRASETERKRELEKRKERKAAKASARTSSQKERNRARMKEARARQSEDGRERERLRGQLRRESQKAESQEIPAEAFAPAQPLPQEAAAAEELLFKSNGMQKPPLERCIRTSNDFDAEKWHETIRQATVGACAACGIVVYQEKPTQLHAYAVAVQEAFGVPNEAIPEHSSRGVFDHGGYLSLLKEHVSRDSSKTFVACDACAAAIQGKKRLPTWNMDLGDHTFPRRRPTDKVDTNRLVDVGVWKHCVGDPARALRKANHVPSEALRVVRPGVGRDLNKPSVDPHNGNGGLLCGCENRKAGGKARDCIKK